MVLATWGMLAHAGPAIDLSAGLAGITAAPTTAGALGLAGVSVWPGERVSVDLRGHGGLLAGPTREVTG